MCELVSWMEKEHRYNNSLERNGMHRYTMNMVDIYIIHTLRTTLFLFSSSSSSCYVYESRKASKMEFVPSLISKETEIDLGMCMYVL